MNNVKYLILSPEKRGLIEKQQYHENTAYFKETDVWSHWQILLPVLIIISPLLQLCPSIASTPIFQEYVLQLSPAKFQKGSQHTCLSSGIQGPRTLLSSHSKREELPKKSAKQPNKWNYKYPGTHKSHVATAQLQAERKQHRSTNTGTHHKKLQCQINLCLTSNWHPVDLAWLRPDPERQLLIHLAAHPLLHRAPKEDNKREREVFSHHTVLKGAEAIYHSTAKVESFTENGFAFQHYPMSACCHHPRVCKL